MKISLIDLKKILHYNPETGIWTYSINRGRMHKGMIAGTKHHSGYFQICINGKIYSSHRLAFFYMKGYWPIEIDHKDNNPSNNIWINLREATRPQNSRNLIKRKDNTSRYKGVYFAKRYNIWRVKIHVNKKQIYLGSYINKHEAAKAYNEGAKKYFEDFAHLNDIGGNIG